MVAQVILRKHVLRRSAFGEGEPRDAHVAAMLVDGEKVLEFRARPDCRDTGVIDVAPAYLANASVCTRLEDCAAVRHFLA